MSDISNKWISVREQLPEEPMYYIVYVHAPDDIQNDPIYEMTEDGEPIDWGFVSLAHFNKAQGGIWELEFDKTPYGSDLSKIDTKHDYYISHWMPKPDKPKEK